MSSHLLADVEDVCDRIAVLHQGELKELGRVDDLLRVTDVTQIRAKGLSAAATEEIREVLRRHGGEDVEMPIQRRGHGAGCCGKGGTGTRPVFLCQNDQDFASKSPRGGAERTLAKISFP